MVRRSVGRLWRRGAALIAASAFAWMLAAGLTAAALAPLYAIAWLVRAHELVADAVLPLATLVIWPILLAALLDRLKV